MRFLLDTNVLLRFVLTDEPEHLVVKRPVNSLLLKGHSVHFSPQSVRELWHVCTRSPAANGIGLSPPEVSGLVGELRVTLDFLDDTPGTFDVWLDLVTTSSITGAKTHDAKHAALAKRNGIDFVVTFDTSNFNRVQVEGVQVVSPGELPE